MWQVKAFAQGQSHLRVVEIWPSSHLQPNPFLDSAASEIAFKLPIQRAVPGGPSAAFSSEAMPMPRRHFLETKGILRQVKVCRGCLLRTAVPAKALQMKAQPHKTAERSEPDGQRRAHWLLVHEMLSPPKICITCRADVPVTNLPMSYHFSRPKRAVWLHCSRENGVAQ